MSRDALQYPAPRYPERPEEPTAVDQLMPYARKAVQKTAGLGTMGNVKPGEKVLLAVPAGQHELAVEAVIRALKEKGIAAEAIGEPEIAGIPEKKLSKQSPLEGWVELYWRDETIQMLGLEPRTIIEFLGTTMLEDFFDRRPEYAKIDKLFVGNGGSRFFRLAMGKHASRYGDAWVYDACEALQSKAGAFPNDILELILLKVTRLLGKVSEVRITDPQGTDVSFSLTSEEAKVWSAANYSTFHIFMYPLQSFMAVNSEPVISSIRQKLLAEGVNISLKYAKAEGVIAGTSNHTGYFPHMKTYLKGGVIYKIEGGGKFGDLLRKFLEKTRNVHYPGYPSPGNLYLLEIALGTCPKYFRRRVDIREGGYPLFVNVYERLRSGVLHWGIGIDDYDPQVVKYAKENNLPRSHIGHAAHTYFTTYEVVLRDTKERVKIIDKGHLTVLDDPEVRTLAAKHGDPDEILSEEWIPAIPGINYPGDYMRDYGANPAEWIRKEVEEQLPATAGVPK